MVKMSTIILIALVALLYLKWVLIAITLPLMAMNGKRKNNPGSKLWALLSVPARVIERLMHGGWERFVLFQVSLIPSLHLRKAIYKFLGARISKNVVFHFKTEIRAPYFLFVGKGSIIGDNVILDARSGLTIGKNVNFSSNVSVYTLQHNHRSPTFSCDFGDRKMSVEIGDRAWIGSNVVVLPGVTIGEGAVCCAGCVVTKDVEPYAVVAGIPAKKVGERPHVLTYEFNGKACRLY